MFYSLIKYIAKILLCKFIGRNSSSGKCLTQTSFAKEKKHFLLIESLLRFIPQIPRDEYFKFSVFPSEKTCSVFFAANKHNRDIKTINQSCLKARAYE